MKKILFLLIEALNSKHIFRKILNNKLKLKVRNIQLFQDFNFNLILKFAKKMFIKNINYLVLRLIIITNIFLLIISCKPSDSYLLTSQSHLRNMERKDHQKCVAQGIDFGKWNDVSTELYWRCRYNLIQSKIIHDATRVSDIKNNAMIQKISKKILENLIKSRQTILSEIESDIETFDHSKCLSMGYSLDMNDERKNEAYYQCRKKLVFEREPVAPKITHTYSASILPQPQFDQYMNNIKENKIIKGEVNFASSMINRYPACKNINVKSKFFQQCIDAQEESVQCLNKVQTLKAKKELENRIYCQQQALIQFPDDYSVTQNKSAKEIAKILEEKRQKELEKKKQENEKTLNKTLKFFEEGYVSKDIRFNNETTDQTNARIKEDKRRKELYHKIQILELREEFILQCNDLMQNKIPQYIEEETNRCLAIGIDWHKETDLDSNL